MKTIFKKTMLVAMVAALVVASPPLMSASAAPSTDNPPPPERELSGERLENIWARQLRVYEKIGAWLDRGDAFADKVQELIDRASANGKDVSAVQAALDAFEQALKDAHPIYKSAKGIINSHQGFDNEGNVTDIEKAKETVKAMGGKLREIKAAMDGTGRALHEAIKAFRKANPRPERNAPSTPEGG